MGYLKGSNVKMGRTHGAIASKSKVSDSVIEPFKGLLKRFRGKPCESFWHRKLLIYEPFLILGYTITKSYAPVKSVGRLM